jgi:hypothetical protein
MAEANSAVAPLAEFVNHIFGNEDDPRRPADQLVFRRVRRGLYEREHRSAVARRHRDPTLTRLKTGIKCQFESKLINVESQAAFLIPYENID